MSSPAVSGIVALLLQIKPDPTPQQIKDIFTETSIRDNFTGTIPPGGNNNWGNGKVNAYGAARRVLQLSAGVEKGYRAVSLLDVYPNPSRGPVSVVYTSDRDEEVGVEIHDLLGRVVVADRWRVVAGDNIRRYDLMARGAGIYFVTVTSGTRSIPAGIVVE